LSQNVAAGLAAGSHGFDERFGLLLCWSLEEGVDAPLAVDQPLGLDPENQDGRRGRALFRIHRSLRLVGMGHKWHHKAGGNIGGPPGGAPQ
jgi:hypothetical protein